MTRGAVREPRRTLPADRRDRSCRELREVRHPSQPGLRVERVLVCPSGIHVVTSVPAPSGDGTPAVGVLAAGRAASDVVAGLLPERYRDRVRPVLCRTDAAPMAELLDGVLVTTPSTLEHVVRASPARLSTSEVGDVVRRLEAGLEPFPVEQPPDACPWRGRAVAGALAAAAAAVAAVVGAVVGVEGLPLPW